MLEYLILGTVFPLMPFAAALLGRSHSPWEKPCSHINLSFSHAAPQLHLSCDHSRTVRGLSQEARFDISLSKM